MSSTVSVGGFEISSSGESAEDMVKALTPPEPKSKTPVALVDRGQPVEQKPEGEAKVTEAARELGKRGGEAAAKAREEKAKEAAKEPAEKAAEEAKPATEHQPKEAQPEEKPAEKPKSEGDPRHDPEARVRRATEEAAQARRDLQQERAERQRDRERLERLERLAESLQGKPAAKPETREATPERDPDEKPRADQFDTYEAYLDARDQYNRQQWTKEHQQQTQASERDRLIAQHRNDLAKVLREAREHDPDLLPQRDEEGRQIAGTGKIDYRLLEMQTSYQATEEAQQEGREPEFGAGNMLADWFTYPPEAVARMRYLTEHPKAIEAFIHAPNPMEASRILGRIEAQLEASRPAREAAAEERQTSSAPPPIKTVQATAVPGNPDYTGDMPFDKFMAVKGQKPPRR